MLTKFYSLEEFAQEVGESVEMLTDKRRTGAFFPPDTVFNKRPYWFRETVDQYLSLKTDAIRQAFGGGGGEQPQLDSACPLGMRR